MSLFSCFKRISPVILLACYSLFGGWLFSYLEGPSNDTSGLLSENDTLQTVAPPMKTDWEKLYEETFENVTSFYNKYDINDYTEDVLRANLTRHLWQLDKDYDHQVPESVVRQIWQDYDNRRHGLDSLVENLITNQNSTIEKYSEPIANPWDLWSATLYAATLYTTIGKQIAAQKLTVYCYMSNKTDFLW